MKLAINNEMKFAQLERPWMQWLTKSLMATT